MKRLTTNDPKDNMETAFNLFCIKDHEVWVRGGGLAPEYADISLFDFIRRAVAAHIPDAELPEDDDDLSMMMAEWLMDDIGTAEGVLGLLYTAAWAYAELRHRLAAYEDTGLTPDEITKAFEGKKAVFDLYFGIDQRRIAHLHELLQAEQKGRLLVLPCKVGDTVWTNISIKGDRYRKSDRPYQVKVVFIGMGAETSYFHVEYSNGRVFPFDSDQIGKTIFLTCEEAEQALVEKNGGDGDG